MRDEIRLRSDFFKEPTEISSLYFGGGTPSVLEIDELASIISEVRRTFNCSDDLEICIEANPDDLSREKLEGYKRLGVNRLSIGVQSLDPAILQWMNRSHTADQSEKAVKLAAELGFRDLTIDLIYGVPGLSSDQWRQEIREVLTWPINHLSAYGLTMESKTPYANFVKKGSYKEPDDELMSEHYGLLLEELTAKGWEQYEVSNYAKEGHYSRHNTAYWFNEPYLGIGPSAHSYYPGIRSWNRSSNAAYIQALSKGELPLETEQLSKVDALNEYLLTRLRTKWGLDIAELQSSFEFDILRERQEQLMEFSNRGWMRIDQQSIRLTPSGILYADRISSDLFEDHSSQMSS